VSYPAASIQTAIIARLRADTTLRGLLTGSATPEWSIYDADGVPDGKACPYVVTFTITNQSGEDMAFGTDAVDTYLQVSIFTESRGYALARSIAARIYALLHMQVLNLASDGFNNYNLIFDGDQELSEDGINQHIPMRFMLQTQG
jgi:hypothetical protein